MTRLSINNTEDSTLEQGHQNRSSLTSEYDKICQTHKRLVKSGVVRCPIKTLKALAKVDLPGVPSSPGQLEIPPHEVRLHWGAIGDTLGVQTFNPWSATPSSVQRGESVIHQTPLTSQSRQASLSLPFHGFDTPPSSRTIVNPRRVSSMDAHLLGDSIVPDFLPADQEVFSSTG